MKHAKKVFFHPRQDQVTNRKTRNILSASRAFMRVPPASHDGFEYLPLCIETNLSVHLQVIIVIESRAYLIRFKLCHVCVVLINKTIWGVKIS